MKRRRSRTIRLLLLGSVSVGTFTGCKPAPTTPAPITENNVYTNDYFVPGIGYYHAPFRRWYPLPYNHFDAGSGRYFYDGRWATVLHQSITNISSPLADAAQRAEAERVDVTRAGFGSTASGHWFAGS